MDYSDPSRRPYAQNPYASQQQQQAGSSSSSSQYATSGAVERFRQTSYVQQSPATVPSTGRASSGQLYGFAQASQYGSVSSASAETMSYVADLQSPDVPRQPDTQQYGQYGIYGLGSQSQQATASSYDQVSRYTQRPGTASETLASQFGGAQAAQYYLAGPTVPTSATMPDLTAPQLASQYQSAYAASSSSTYGSAAMLDPTQASAYSATYSTQYTPQAAQSADQAFNHYQSQIRTVFSCVTEGRLRDVGDILLQMSYYLLGNAEALGLTRDDDSLHDERIRLWDEFNKSWLVTLQAQFDMTDELLRNNRPINEPQSIMTQRNLETLSRELVRLCDSVEKHGLVDYQMGVAEEEIMDLLLRCLSLLDPPEPASPVEEAADSSSATGRAR